MARNPGRNHLPALLAISLAWWLLMYGIAALSAST